MAQNKTRAWSAAVVAVTLGLGGFAISGSGLAPRVRAEGAQNAMDSSSSIYDVLKSHEGKRVKVKLVSGQDLEGQVAKVGNAGLHLTGLTGMEFFDATVRVDQVAAVIVRRAQ